MFLAFSDVSARVEGGKSDRERTSPTKGQSGAKGVQSQRIVSKYFRTAPQINLESVDLDRIVTSIVVDGSQPRQEGRSSERYTTIFFVNLLEY